MNEEKIGKFIALNRKKKNLTQKDLADILNVTDKSVSKWERGVCLPNPSLYKELCSTLDITLNDLFAGEKIKEEEYKEKADENLLNALENSVFTLKERINYFKNKWQKEHFFELTIEMIIIVAAIIFGFIYQNGLQFLAIFAGFIWGIFENNRQMAYVEKHAYGPTNIEDLKNSLTRFQEVKNILSKFESREEAIDYLVKETKLSVSECTNAYDILIKLDINKIKR